MNSEASFEHVVHIQILKCFLFMALLKHAIDDAIVPYPESLVSG